MSLRVRLRVDGGPIGVSLQAPDGKEFEASRVVSSTEEPLQVLLPVADLSQRGSLIVHTWDQPNGARVRIDDVSLVW